MLRRICYKLWFVLITVLCAAIPFTSPSLLQAQGADDMKAVESALLRTPDKCGKPCMWDFKLGQQTRAEFTQFAASVFPQSAVSKLPAGATGIYANGVAFQIVPEYIFQPRDPNIVGAVYVRVVLSETQKTGVLVDGFMPAGMLRGFGTPSQAFLLHGDTKRNTQKPVNFRLLLAFSNQNQSVFYVITGIMRGDNRHYLK